MTSLIMRAHLRQALRPATCPLLQRGSNARRTFVTLRESLVCPVSSKSDISLPIYEYSTRSPRRPQAGATAPFLRRPQMAPHLSTSNSQYQRRLEVPAMRDIIRSNSLQQVTLVSLILLSSPDVCMHAHVTLNQPQPQPCIQRASWARSKPLRRNRARKKLAHRQWCTPMSPWDDPWIVPDSA